MQRILVTGGAGYIGSHTMASLLSQGIMPICIDDFSNSYPHHLDDLKAHFQTDFPIFNVDLKDEEKVKDIFKKMGKIDGIIHFAAHKSVPESVAEPIKYYKNNVEPLFLLGKMALKHGISRFIFSSSCSVYGDVLESPVSEETPLLPPKSPYAQTKILGEEFLAKFSNNSKFFRSIALRYFNPIGAHPQLILGENPKSTRTNILPVLTGVASGQLPHIEVFGNDYSTSDGTCIRDYIHVCDIAEAHVLALNLLLIKDDLKPFQVINLGSGVGYTVLEMIHAFEVANHIILKKKICPRRSGDVAAIFANPNLAYQILGWKPKYSLQEMMTSAWAWEKKLLEFNSSS